MTVNKIWWAQIVAVVRLEMKKTFFARRGLWIYVLALLPVAMFFIYAIATAERQHLKHGLSQRQEKQLSYQDLLSIRPDMTKDEVVALLGKPPANYHWTETQTEDGQQKKITHENYHYSDGQNDLFVDLSDGRVVSINIDEEFNLGRDAMMYAGVFQFFFLRLAIFFGCLGVFMNLFRGEVLDKSLHFYFLAPIRREVLMLGKFLAGLMATTVIFVTSDVLQTIAFLWHFPPAVRDVYLYHNHGLEHAFIYIGVTVLACIGYGAFFLVAGMMFRNPIFPAAAILIWEGINPFLPAVLKQFSVIYYLKSLCPVDVASAPGTPPFFALLVSNADPISAPVAVLGILAVATIALYVSSLQVRRMEINYTSE